MENMEMGGRDHYKQELNNLKRNIPDYSISDESMEQWCYELYRDFDETLGMTYEDFEMEWPNILKMIKDHRPKLYKSMTEKIVWLGYTEEK